MHSSSNLIGQTDDGESGFREIFNEESPKRKRGPLGVLHRAERDSKSAQTTEEIPFVPNAMILPNGFNLDGLAKQRKTVIPQTGVEDRIFQDELRPERVRDSSRSSRVVDRIHRLRLLNVRPET